MNWQTLAVITFIFSVIFFSLQRADPSRRKVVRNFAWFVVLLLAIYVWWYSAYWETLLGLIISAVFSGLFWVLIGRYNPVTSSDEIRVLGMDD